ncbi:DUF6445 family protein, partial [Sandarakinorhabdus sp.]|uniref:DUF6445 family protein n=1 Tax=Sandarakinorhabdus sp. TaxID=1916663 RepID=UPI00333F191A
MTTAPQIAVSQIGRDGQPIAVIDNFFPAAAALRAAALAASFGPARNLYPGIRAE